MRLEQTPDPSVMEVVADDTWPVRTRLGRVVRQDDDAWHVEIWHSGVWEWFGTPKRSAMDAALALAQAYTDVKRYQRERAS